MRDKIIAVITLTSIFSLFIYYKVNDVNNITVTQIDEEINEKEIIINLVSDIDSESKDTNYLGNLNLLNEDCSLSLKQTDNYSFSEAFKYYRKCLGEDEVFSWNLNSYKTLLSTETHIESNKDDSGKMVVQNSNTVDKHHLDLQNQMFSNSSSE